MSSSNPASQSNEPRRPRKNNAHGISPLELQRAARTIIDKAYVHPALADWAHLVVEPLNASSPDDQPSGCIFLGPQQAAGKTKLEALKSASPPVGAIVNCTNAFPNHHEDDSIIYCRVAINDEVGANILVYLDGVTEFIHHRVMNGIPVLVHCQMGMSRSATVIIAYLMRYRSMSKQEAYRHVKERRPQTNPNAGFWGQLDLYEQRLCRKGAEADSVKKEVKFDKEWAESSLCLFQTIGHIVENAVELFPEINTDCNLHDIIFTAVDFVCGRGVLESDLSWFSALCTSFRDLNTDPIPLLDNLFADDSHFMDLWCDEVSLSDIQRIKENAMAKANIITNKFGAK